MIICNICSSNFDRVKEPYTMIDDCPICNECTTDGIKVECTMCKRYIYSTGNLRFDKKKQPICFDCSLYNTDFPESTCVSCGIKTNYGLDNNKGQTLCWQCNEDSKLELLKPGLTYKYNEFIVVLGAYVFGLLCGSIVSLTIYFFTNWIKNNG